MFAGFLLAGIGSPTEMDYMKTPAAHAVAAPRFRLGQIVATAGALRLLDKHQSTPSEYLLRHVSGDWGSVPPEDAMANEEALKGGLRVLSSYSIGEADKLWIITEADRSVTTLLLPADY